MGRPIFILAGQSNAQRVAGEVQTALDKTYGKGGYVLISAYAPGAPLTWQRAGHEDWATASELPDLLADRTVAVLRANPDAYLANMIWLQGEADTKSVGTPSDYANDFLKVIDTFRKAVNGAEGAGTTAKFGVTIAGLSDHAPDAGGRVHWQAIQTALEKLGSSKGWINTVNVDTLAKQNGLSGSAIFSDGLHYTDSFSQTLANALVKTASGTANKGNTTYVIQTGQEAIDEAPDGGWDSVFASVSVALRNHSQHVEALTLTGKANLNGIGNGQNNVIVGNAGNNVLDGAWGDDNLIGGAGSDIFRDASGADRMLGGQGSDIYYVDNAGDSITELPGQGWDAVFSSVSFTLRQYSQHIEALTLTGTKNLSAVGNSQQNRIVGNAGNNVIDGAWGNDKLIGGAGNDTFRDAQGADEMMGGQGNDTYYVDHAGDKVVELAGQGWDHVIASVSFELRDHSQHIEALTLTGKANINGTGNAQNNRIVGNDGDNTLNGAWGDDTLIGGVGDDMLLEYHGKNVMTGGGGADTFCFRAGGSDTTITDFDLSERNERIDLSRLGAIQSFNDLVQNHLEQKGQVTIIDDGLGTIIRLEGIRQGDLTAEDFLF
ncbi:calcium-binding protein [Pseudoprimorskyibacter insulae]|uniref:Bifunctional hemolysin/adenylate cyclase n=1 Tax=Pseudoprimorskyibacter insulae TaxID=1695997 RepID=A0A2R8ANV0_9RHOB|nr:calcium-binding protein [Pseudoprimorskyibacter insulae]SPF77695.1 Bifunctional hemolysin/adenylate cyclase [Pseudoprimorskyibacter insulae]